MKTLRSFALAGNVLFILWIFYNGIDEGPKGVGTVQAFALTGLVTLLILNSIVLYWKEK